MTGPVDVPCGFRIAEWSVGEPLGHGAWGSVYAGTSDRGEQVALKVLPAEALTPGHSAHLRDVVERELRFSAGGGRGLIRTHAILRVPAGPSALSGAHVLVMERAAGSLADLFSAGDPVDDAGRLAAGLWDAVSGVHADGWVHGDVKPSNVLVLDDGAVRLADFGLATEIDGTHAYAPHAASLDAVGPEWWSARVGERGVRVRPARDLWSVGVVCHQLFSGGRFPFDGQTPRARALAAQTYARGHAPLRLDPGVPEAWRPVVRLLLEPDEYRREDHRAEVDERMAELRPDHADLSDATVVRRTPPSPRDAPAPAGPTAAGRDAGRAPRTRGDGRRRARRRRAGTAIASVAVLAVGGGALATAVDHGDDPVPGRPFVGGELRGDADVPDDLRAPVEAAAHRCDADEVTPALIAAILGEESGFDAALQDGERDEYGIARWTPDVFRGWAVDADGGGASPMSAADSISTLGAFLCAVRSRVSGARGDRALLLAAAYRVGSACVRDAGAVPASAARYAAAVARRATAYARPADRG